MATTRKTRARTANGEFRADDPSTPENEAWKTSVSVQDLAAYIDYDGDSPALSRAVELASAAVREEFGAELPAELPHELAQAVRLAASKLLLTGKLDEPMQAGDLPAVARYFVKLASARS